jgi:hypothetical protein
MLLLLQHKYLHLQRLGIWEPQAGRQAGRTGVYKAKESQKRKFQKQNQKT